MALATESVDNQGRRGIDPEHLLYGVLQDAADPYGTGLGWRGRKHLAQLGWSLGASNPATEILNSHGLNPGRLHAELSAQLGAAQ